MFADVAAAALLVADALGGVLAAQLLDQRLGLARDLVGELHATNKFLF